MITPERGWGLVDDLTGRIVPIDLSPKLPHEPTGACAAVHCYAHGVDESDDGAYRVCGECGHVFPTAAALLADHAALVERLNANPIADPRSDKPPVLLEPKTDPDTIWSCPHCAHDF